MIHDERTMRQTVPWAVKNLNNLGDNYGPGEQIKVRCIDPRGVYYNFMRRRQGDVFTLIPQYVAVLDPVTMKPVMENGQPKTKLISAKEQFSAQTMELVDQQEPETMTTAQDAVNKTINELNEAKIPTRRR